MSPSIFRFKNFRVCAVALAGSALFCADALSAELARETNSRVIDAAKFESLQAALDEVPTNGGMVYLPPGNFEIREPLILTNGETRITGSGAATHILNLRTRLEFRVNFLQQKPAAMERTLKATVTASLGREPVTADTSKLL